MAAHADLLEALEPWGAATIEEDLSGFRNRVWSIRLRGERHVARQPLREPHTLNWELDLLEALSREGFNVPVPMPSAAGERHIDGLVVFTFLPGTVRGAHETGASWGTSCAACTSSRRGGHSDRASARAGSM